jgi:ABC-type dipeptide/oligopeptide/nickel transport system permease component
MLPDDATIEQIEAFQRLHGLDQPIYVQLTVNC